MPQRRLHAFSFFLSAMKLHQIDFPGNSDFTSPAGTRVTVMFLQSPVKPVARHTNIPQQTQMFAWCVMAVYPGFRMFGQSQPVFLSDEVWSACKAFKPGWYVFSTTIVTENLKVAIIVCPEHMQSL